MKNITGGSNNTVFSFNANHIEKTSVLKFDPTGQFLVVGSYDFTITRWDVSLALTVPVLDSTSEYNGVINSVEYSSKPS